MGNKLQIPDINPPGQIGSDEPDKYNMKEQDLQYWYDMGKQFRQRLDTNNEKIERMWDLSDDTRIEQHEAIKRRIVEIQRELQGKMWNAELGYFRAGLDYKNNR